MLKSLPVPKKKNKNNKKKTISGEYEFLHMILYSFFTLNHQEAYAISRDIIQNKTKQETWFHYNKALFPEDL